MASVRRSSRMFALLTYTCVDLSLNWMEEQHGAGEPLVFADLMNTGGFPLVIWHTYYQLKVRRRSSPKAHATVSRSNIRLYFTCILLKFTPPSLKLSPWSFLSKRTYHWIMPQRTVKFDLQNFGKSSNNSWKLHKYLIPLLIWDYLILSTILSNFKTGNGKLFSWLQYRMRLLG